MRPARPLFLASLFAAVSAALAQPPTPTDPAAAVGQITMSNAEGKDRASATVFWIGPTRAVTNWHVIQHGARAVIEMSGGATHRVTRLVGVDERADIAIVEADPPFADAPLTLADSAPTPGTPVRVLTTKLLFADNVNEATILRTDEIAFFGPTLVLYTEHASPPGWSGSPVLDGHQRVVGVARSCGPAKGFAAPTAAIAAILAAGGAGLAYEDWSHQPQTRFGRAMLRSITAAHPGKSDAAAVEDALRRATEESPDFWLGWARLSELASARGDTDAAISAMERAAALSPEAHHGLYLADLYQKKGRAADADAARARSIRTDPIGYAFMEDRRRALKRAEHGQWNEAAPSLARAVAGQPEDAELRAAYAQCLALIGRSREAIPQADYALSLDKNYMPAYYARGLALTMLKEWAQSVEPLKRAIGLDPASVAARGLLAESLARPGHDAGAEEQLAQLDRLDPPYAARFRAELRRRVPRPAR